CLRVQPKIQIDDWKFWRGLLKRTESRKADVFQSASQSARPKHNCIEKDNCLRDRGLRKWAWFGILNLPGLPNPNSRVPDEGARRSKESDLSPQVILSFSYVVVSLA